MRVCSECQESLLETTFNKRKASPDGLAYRCRNCDNKASAKWRNGNPEQSAKLKALAYQRRKDHYDSRNKIWVSENKQKRLTISKNYYSSNVKVHGDRVRQWRIENPNAVNEMRMRYVCSKLNATPHWLTKDHISQMRVMYGHAIDCYRVSGQRYQVDHIVPLQGENVCGLNVPWNLQILPSDMNTKKANRYDDWNT